MNYNLTSLDPQHEEAYRKCTDLLQKFMARQWKINREDGHDAEKRVNRQIISFIQWVKYHLQGNDDATIEIKCPNVCPRFWGGNLRKIISMYHTPFGCEVLGIDPKDIGNNGSEVVDAILKYILPERSNSIFAMDDNVQESITLRTEVERIRRKYDTIR